MTPDPAVQPPVPARRGAVVLGLLVGVLAVSSSAILIRIADAPPLALAFWRCAGGAVALAPFAVRARRRGAGRLDGVQRLRLAGSGILLALHFGLWITSLSYTTVASSATLVATSPLFVGIGSALFLAEPPTRRTWTGMALAMTGAVGVGVVDLSASDLGRPGLLGDVMAVGGAVMMAGYLLIGRAARRQLALPVYAAGAYGIAAVVLLAGALAARVPLGGYDAATWLAVAALVAGPQLLGHTVFNWLLSRVAATVVAICVLAEPVGATVLAWVVLAELPDPWFWAAAPFVLAGVWLAVTRGPPTAIGALTRRRPRPPTPPVA